MTVREMVHAAQKEIRDTELVPARAADLLVKLTALLGNCNDEIRAADHDYATTLLQCYKQEETANRAKITAETSTEYLRKMEARHTKELCLELARSLKVFIRSAEEEMRLTK